jgi:hypothetical protein
MRKLPQGIWTDTVLKKKFRFVGYDAPSRCYRIQYVAMWGLRIWLAADWVTNPTYRAAGRYTPPTAWDQVQDGLLL